MTRRYRRGLWPFLVMMLGFVACQTPDPVTINSLCERYADGPPFDPDPASVLTNEDWREVSRLFLHWQVRCPAAFATWCADKADLSVCGEQQE